MKVSISNEETGIKGTVYYNEGQKDIIVSLPDPESVKLVRSHLTKIRSFNIPESDEIDDYRIDKVKPTESEQYMRLALCTLHTETDFWVHWESLEE